MATGRWLWVPAFAGTTGEILFAVEKCGIADACATTQLSESSSPPLEQLIELALPFAVFIGTHQHRDDLLLRQPLDDAGWIRRHVRARRQPAEPGEKLLALLA